jgi:RsiW-degrading membrane proteinase PrsW (M82 family)
VISRQRIANAANPVVIKLAVAPSRAVARADWGMQWYNAAWLIHTERHRDVDMNGPIIATEITGTSLQVQDSAWLRAAEVIALVGGALAILVGLVAGILYLLFAALPTSVIGPHTMGSIAVSFAALVLGGMLGGGLVFHAIMALRRRSSLRLSLPSPIWVILAFGFVLALGAAAPGSVRDSKFVFPIFYFLGISLPVAIVLFTVQRRLTRRGLSGSWREAVLQLSSGAAVSTSGAMLLEAVVVVFLIVLVVLWITLAPNAAMRWRGWLPDLRNLGRTAQPADFEALLSSPVVLGLAFFVLAVAAPLIEEATKAIGVVFMVYRRPSPQQALWWGLLGGAGFTLTEGLLNGSISLGQMSWSTLALIRVGTTVMHCTTGALMGLGWRSLLLERRIGAWLKRYLQAFLLHGFWNALTLGLLAVPALNGARIGELRPVELAVLFFVGLLLLLEVVGLVAILRRVTAPSLVQPSKPDRAIS